mmetsp:Transcript_24570/g.44308  ORF Transcript_24570/g.44308 Transcript_24570/m.44308 type:complete len:160 (+) Transcript_24570:1000-1479(+)
MGQKASHIESQQAKPTTLMKNKTSNVYLNKHSGGREVASKTYQVMSNLMPERIIPRGTTPRSHTEHIIQTRTSIRNAAISIIINNKPHNIRTILLSFSMSIVHDPILSFSQIIQCVTKCTPRRRFGVVGVIGMDQVQFNQDSGEGIGSVGLFYCEVDET